MEHKASEEEIYKIAEQYETQFKNLSDRFILKCFFALSNLTPDISKASYEHSALNKAFNRYAKFYADLEKKFVKIKNVQDMPIHPLTVVKTINIIALFVLIHLMKIHGNEMTKVKNEISKFNEDNESESWQKRLIITEMLRKIDDLMQLDENGINSRMLASNDYDRLKKDTLEFQKLKTNGTLTKENIAIHSNQSTYDHDALRYTYHYVVSILQDDFFGAYGNHKLSKPKLIAMEESNDGKPPRPIFERRSKIESKYIANIQNYAQYYQELTEDIFTNTKEYKRIKKEVHDFSFITKCRYDYPYNGDEKEPIFKEYAFALFEGWKIQSVVSSLDFTTITAFSKDLKSNIQASSSLNRDTVQDELFNELLEYRKVAFYFPLAILCNMNLLTIPAAYNIAVSLVSHFHANQKMINKGTFKTNFPHIQEKLKLFEIDNFLTSNADRLF
jgi:hypothetical protein